MWIFIFWGQKNQILLKNHQKYQKHLRLKVKFRKQINNNEIYLICFDIILQFLNDFYDHQKELC